MARPKWVDSFIFQVVFLLLSGLMVVPVFSAVLLSNPTEKIIPPRLIRYREPEYPAEKRPNGPSFGMMRLPIAIDDQGFLHFSSSSILPGFSDEIFQSIKAAVRQWRFEPARWQGRPAGYTAILALNWDLRKGKETGADSKTLSWKLEESGEILNGILYRRLEPSFPEEAIRQGIQGDVILEISVDEWGRVREVQALDGPEPLKAAAIQVARHYGFSPGRRGAEPQPFTCKKTVSFQLPKNAPPGWTRNGLAVREISERVLSERLIRRVSPQYPTEARVQEVTDLVTLRILIDEKGDVEDARILEGDPLLQEAALEAIRQYKFLPLREYSSGDPAGRAIPVSSRWRFAFTKQDTSPGGVMVIDVPERQMPPPNR